MNKESNKSFIDKVGDILNLERKVSEQEKRLDNQSQAMEVMAMQIDDLIGRVKELESNKVY